MTNMTQDGIHEHGGIRPDRLSRVPWPAVVVFVVVASVLAWIIALPLWIIDSARPGYQAMFTAFAAVIMFTPLVATLVVVFLFKTPKRQRLRFLGMWPLRPAGRVVWFIVSSLFAPILLVLATVLVSAVFGWLQLDLVSFSGFAAMLEAQLAMLDAESAAVARASMPPMALLVALQLLTIPFGALINSIFAFGEELGWRGWLLPALRPLGVWPALILSGIIWGLWHSPIILLGYNFNRTDWTGVAIMTVGCVFWGIFFGWLRLRSASVWPAVIAHGSLNAAAGLSLMLSASGQTPDLALISPLGVAGWIVVAVLVLALLLCGQFRREPELAAPRQNSLPQNQAGHGDQPNPNAG